MISIVISVIIGVVFMRIGIDVFAKGVDMTSIGITKILKMFKK